MNRMQEQILEFIKAVGQEHYEITTIPEPKTKGLRMKLIYEETQELFEAIVNDNIVGVADGIADLLYVVIGTAIAYGIDVEKIFDEVHRSNMSKIWPDGTVRKNEYGKVLKPPTFSPPNLKDLL